MVKDGDLVALAQYMIRTRGWQTVRVTEVKGHATDAGGEQGRVRLLDQVGNARLILLQILVGVIDLS